MIGQFFKQSTNKSMFKVLNIGTTSTLSNCRKKTIEVLLNWQESFMQLVEQSTNEPRFEGSKLATAGNPEKIAEKTKKFLSHWQAMKVLLVK